MCEYDENTRDFIVDVKFLSNHLQVSDRSIRNYVDSGLEFFGSKNSKRFYLLKSIDWYKNNINQAQVKVKDVDFEANSSVSDVEIELKKERIKKLKLEMEILELDMSIKKREYIHISELKSVISYIALNTKSALLNIIKSLPRNFGAFESEAREILKSKLTHNLKELSELIYEDSR